MVRPVFCNLSTHDAACILISSAIHASSVIVTERKALWSVKWLHCLENDRWPTVIFSSAMSITWNCIPTTLVVHRAICHTFYTTNHCGYWGDSHWQAVTAPLCGTFCLLLGYRNYYAIHGSPYTSAHVLIEKYIGTAQNGQELAWRCVVRIESLKALTSIMGFMLVPVSLSIILWLRC